MPTPTWTDEELLAHLENPDEPTNTDKEMASATRLRELSAENQRLKARLMERGIDPDMQHEQLDAEDADRMEPGEAARLAEVLREMPRDETPDP